MIPFTSPPSYKGLDKFEFGMNDAWWVPKDCPFNYHKGHKGGYGDPLEIIGCGKGIYFYWAFDDLMQVDLTFGWAGTTDRGIGLEARLEDILAAYPEARKCSKKTESRKNNRWELRFSV